MRRFWLIACVVTTALLGTTQAQAGFLVSGAGSGNNSGFQSNQTGTVGFEFTVGSQDLVVTSLGVLDLDFIAAGNGLAYSHKVSLWDATGTTLLGSATVPAGTTAPLVNGFRFVELATSIKILAGQSYVLGAYYEDPQGVFANDLFRSNNAGQMQAIISADVTYVQGRFAFGNVFPGSPASTGYVGPNFEYSVFSDPPVTATPEPASLVSGLIGLATLGGLRLRRKASATVV